MTPSVTPDYVRADWGRWVDSDKDCQDTRQEVLIEESEIPVTFESEKKCRVASGKWTCPLTGNVFVTPQGIDIDHIVPLREAHESGGYAWAKDKKKSYFNDLEPEHLMAVDASANRSKGSKSPDKWMPSTKKCEYLRAWVKIKGKWGLKYDCEEAQGIVRLMGLLCD
jgi:hypothetical protein